MELLQKIVDRMKADGANVMDAGLYLDGTYEEMPILNIAGVLNCYSIAKAYTAAAIGIALADGKLTLDDHITDIFADKIRECGIDASDNLKKVTLRHLLTQTSGIDHGFLFEEDRYQSGWTDWLAQCLSVPYLHEPGTKFVYTNSNFYLLSCVIHKLTGENMEYYLKKRFFAPLDIHTVAFEHCPHGEAMGATGLYMFTKDMVKLGIVLMHGGDGLLPSDYVREMISTQIQAEEKYGYGFGIWTRKDGYFFSGAHGQIVSIYPDKNLIFAAHANDAYEFDDMLREMING